MKLSTEPLPRCTLVKGTRLLKVLHDHVVDTRGSGFLAERKAVAVEGSVPIATESPQAGKDQVKAVAGDLAVEVADAKTGQVLGYSYLTGNAITCMTYEIAPHRFEGAQAARLYELEQLIADVQRLPDGDDDGFRSLTGRMIGVLQTAKHSEHDVVVFEVIIGDDYQRVAEVVMRLWSQYQPNEGGKAPDDQACHLAGVTWRRKLKKSIFRRKASPCALMHLQPKRHACDHAMTPFQVQLLLGFAPVVHFIAEDEADADAESAKAG